MLRISIVRVTALRVGALRRHLSTSTEEVKPIKKILIANRGEIACRVARTAKRMGIKTVAVYSEADARSVHVKVCDEAVCVGPAASRESYLNVDNIIKAMHDTGAQAVHPGYGFLSENYHFVERLKKEGLIFIGPDAFAMHAMGDKIESKKLAIKAGVNTIPGFMGVLKDEAEAVKVAREIGYPVMIKASAGGGGKGMRIAWNDAEAAEGFRLSKAEAASSFGDDRCFVEKYLEQPRHIEIQIIADSHGNVVYLPERECSIQRRNQKVIEEAPSMCLDEALWRAMGEQAVQLAKAVQYKSAGTVEMMVDKHKKFYFLEMNTRLQVEHPVTEMVTGLDLVEIMLRVAAGEKLPVKQSDIKPKGWAFEARVYAEDPLRGFLPAIGNLQKYVIPDGKLAQEGEIIRVDTGVEEGSEISIHYDPMIAKLITYGPTRDKAAECMVRALDAFVIRGVGCNINFMRDVMVHPRFLSGNITTGFIPEEFPKGYHGHTLSSPESAELAAAAAIINIQFDQQCKILLPPEGSYIAGKPTVGRAALVSVIGENSVVLEKDLIANIEGSGGAVHEKLKRNLHIKALRPRLGQVISTDFEVSVEGEPNPIQIYSPIPGQNNIIKLNIKVDGKETNDSKNLRTLQIVSKFTQGLVLSLGGTFFKVTARTPYLESLHKHMPLPVEVDHSKELIAPMPGRLHSIAVKEGQKVVVGQELCIMEAMKMQNVLRAEKDAVVKKVVAKVGDTLAVDQSILLFE